MGIDKSTIDEYCQLSSENEIRAKLQELILNENATIDTEKTKVEKQAVEELKNTYFNQLKNTGVDEVVANQTADLYAYSFAKLAKDNGISIKDIPEANIDFRKLTPEQAIEQFKQGFKDNTQVKFQKLELPKYIEEDKKIAATNRHYEGGETSPKINKILDFVREGNSLEATVQKFQTKDFDDGRITKIYNDFQNDVYKYVEGTPERIEKKKVLNPEYVPLFNGTEEKANEIIEHYKENTSTDTVGHGYSGYSMSNNAKNAYKKGSMPLSKWNKKNIIERIKNIVENYDIPFDVSKLDKMTVKDIKSEYLKKDGYHHTSKFYNTTDFYKIDIEKILENKDNTQVNKTENFASFEELQEAFKNDIEEAPEDYEISDLNKALKDLGITENKPKEVKTPYETIQVRARNIEHIINGGDSNLHNPDKSRYKSINRMFATLERPNIITINEQGKRAYFKIFEDNNKTKRQITYVSTDEQGNFVLTTIPVKKESWFLKQINNGRIIFDRRKGVIKNSPVNNSIANSDTDFNPDVKTLFQPAYHGSAKDFEDTMFRIRYGTITDVNDSGVKFNDKLLLTPKQIANQGYDIKTFENRMGETITLDFNRDMVKDLKFEKLPLEKQKEKPKFNTEPINTELEAIAKEHFGTTLNIKVAGFILSDGSMLDFSGARFGGNANIRSIDHREVNDAFLENEDYEDIGFDEFIDNGAIRYMPEANAFLIARMPSEKQFETIKNIIEERSEDVTFEFTNGMSNWGNNDNFTKTYDRFSDPNKVLNDARTYFNGGYISKHKKYLQSDDSNIADTEKGIMNAKGFFYEKTLFDGTLKDNIMVLIDQKADASTLVHEFGHIYLQALNRLAKTSPRAKEQLLTVNKWLRFDGNEYTEAQHEKFANGFIAYVKSGKAPSYGFSIKSDVINGIKLSAKEFQLRPVKPEFKKTDIKSVFFLNNKKI